MVVIESVVSSVMTIEIGVVVSTCASSGSCTFGKGHLDSQPIPLRPPADVSGGRGWSHVRPCRNA